VCFEILEYCDPQNVIEREQYYLDFLKPEYNILKIAGSSLGFKHTKETLAKMAVIKLGKNFSKATRAKMAAAKLGKTRPKRARSLLQKISVFDLLTSKTTVYDSISATAEAIGIKQSQISIYFIRNQKTV
jgi:group I intron endonuclease